ncbi:hypothetical protein CARUB_v10021346mg [Capsella rubella]|uniref:Uncharacterized protein n=1 Tax=Capsella rubella TaxID=81985 RepID=R0GDZ6_9BRAS|nr:hypothetical protein CARUB_v10021346mg [Capsella rubella]
MEEEEAEKKMREKKQKENDFKRMVKEEKKKAKEEKKKAKETKGKNGPAPEATTSEESASGDASVTGETSNDAGVTGEASEASVGETVPVENHIGVDDSRAFDSSRSSSVCSALDPNLNYKPVIGILTHPGDGRWDARRHSLSLSYAYASNISYIAASYVKLAETGGARVIPLIYNEPEELLFQNRDILERFNSVNYASSLQFFENVDIEATVFQRFPPELLKKLSTDCLVMQNHYFAISPENFQGNPSLSSFFNILTTSADKDGKER